MDAHQGAGHASRRLGARASIASWRYWTASLLPAIAGTTLPFWLRPPGFTFRWLEAIEFLFAALLFHVGFSVLLTYFEDRSALGWPRSRFLGMAAGCLAAACVLGVHINSGLTLHDGVPRSIFAIYGLCVLFVGMLFIAPPFRFYQRAGGEVVLCEALGMLPLLGAYLVQVGDLTRVVYLASIPLIIATALWVWTDKLLTRADDAREGRRTLAMLFSPHFSGRAVTLGLTVFLYVTLLLAVLVSALPPWALAAGVSLVFAWRVVVLSWREYASSARMLGARDKAFATYVVTGVFIAVSPLVALCGQS